MPTLLKNGIDEKYTYHFINVGLQIDEYYFRLNLFISKNLEDNNYSLTGHH